MDTRKGRRPQVVDTKCAVKSLIAGISNHDVSGIMVKQHDLSEGDTVMAVKPLNADEIAKLRGNPYIASVISGNISFTPEFKHRAYKRMIKGIPMQEILIEHGIDPDILGISRVYGITYRLRQYGKREEGFIDLRKQNSRKPAVETKEQTLATRVMQLEHELAYTQQEVEFLKKMNSADLEARKQWESRQRRK